MILKNLKLLLVALVLISLVLLVTMVWGVYSVQAKNKKTSELLHLADQAVEVAILAQSIRIAQNNAAGDLEAFDRITLSNDTLVPLIENIEEAGQALGLDTKIISVGRIEDKKSIEPDIIRIMVEAQGAWAGTFAFLHAIESLPNRVMIDESSLSQVGNGWRLGITLSLYSFD